MAAPISRWLISKAPKFCTNFAKSKRPNGFPLDNIIYSNNLNHYVTYLQSRFWIGLSRTAFYFKPISEWDKGSVKFRRLTGPTNVEQHKRPYSTSQQPEKRGEKKTLHLMDFAEKLWPHVFKSFRNMMYTILIKGYFDETFTQASFLNGAQQAVTVVSDLISRGQFDDLEGLVTKEAIAEVQHNYQQLDDAQRDFVKVNPKDIFFKAIYEIGMIFDNDTDKRFVEITTIHHGIHGSNNFDNFAQMEYAEMMEEKNKNYYVCNYRLIKEFTKGLESDWVINKLNHFLVADLVKNTSLFQR